MSETNQISEAGPLGTFQARREDAAAKKYPQRFYNLESSQLCAMAWLDAQGDDLIAKLKADEPDAGPHIGELQIIFKGGARYSYHPVPRKYIVGLLSAESCGRYFAQTIKGNSKYIYVKLESVKIEPAAIK